MKPGDLFRVKSRNPGFEETVTLGTDDLDAEEQEVAIGTLGLIIGLHRGGGLPDSHSVMVDGLIGWLFSSEIEVVDETG